jgi:hypothetical protein
MGWVVDGTPPPAASPPGKRPVAILQEAGWAPGPVWTGANDLAPAGMAPYGHRTTNRQFSSPWSSLV